MKKVDIWNEEYRSTLTVGELITELQKYPLNAKLSFDKFYGYYEGEPVEVTLQVKYNESK